MSSENGVEKAYIGIVTVQWQYDVCYHMLLLRIADKA